MSPSTQPPTVDLSGVERLPEVRGETTPRYLEGVLDRECAVFTRYLSLQDPVEYVKEKYRQAHLVNEELTGHATSPFERLLLRLARTHTLLTRAVDIYTSYFLKESIFRKKIVLLLAILESSAPSYKFFDDPDGIGLPALFLRTLLHSLAFLVSVIVSLVLLTPVHLAMSAGRLLPRKEGTK